MSFGKSLEVSSEAVVDSSPLNKASKMLDPILRIVMIILEKRKMKRLMTKISKPRMIKAKKTTYH